MKAQTSKRVLAIHDLSGWGHTSLLAVVPIMYRLGISVACLPTGVLSTNTDYPGYRMDDQTTQMQRSLEHWVKLGARFDAVHTGFLGSPGQVNKLLDYIPKLLKPEALVLVDPVMGDNGTLYSCYDAGIVAPMRELVSIADVISPNLFEAVTLTGYEQEGTISEAALDGICRRLQALGAKNVVITSAETSDDQSCAVATLGTDGSFSLRETPRIPATYNGTGDVFASLLLGFMLRGSSLTQATDKAMLAVAQGISLSASTQQDPRDGLCLELLLNSRAFAGMLDNN